jgi:hypothetical protein
MAWHGIIESTKFNYVTSTVHPIQCFLDLYQATPRNIYKYVLPVRIINNLLALFISHFVRFSGFHGLGWIVCFDSECISVLSPELKAIAI